MTMYPRTVERVSPRMKMMIRQIRLTEHHQAVIELLVTQMQVLLHPHDSSVSDLATILCDVCQSNVGRGRIQGIID